MNSKSLFMTVSAIIIVMIFVLGILLPGLSDTIGLSGERYYENEGIRYTPTDDLGHSIAVGYDGRYIITTDGEVSEYAKYVPPTRGVAGAIGLGVYEAYNDNGVLVSQAGRSPTVSVGMDDFRTMALANNTNNLYGTYQLWNYYQYTLYKMMGVTVMGNTDSQYMMGAGYSGKTAPIDTGTTTSAYEVSPNNSTPACLFLENSWGNLNEYVGDTVFTDRTMAVDNTLGGHPYSSIVNTLSSTVTLPTVSSKTITSIYLGADSWGTPLTTGNASTAGQGINDIQYNATSLKLLATGGSWRANANAGLFSYAADQDVAGANNTGARLAYVIPNAESDTSFAYRVIMGEGGTTVSDVQVLSEGEWVSKMPSAKVLNSFWAFDRETGVGPFGCYYAAVNLSSGPNADDVREQRLSLVKGEIAYRLNPYNYVQTMRGNGYTPNLYNIMLVVPTVYWGVDGNTLYLGSQADIVEGIPLYPYAHAYSIADDVDTGNPEYVPEYVPLAVGSESTILLYANGEIHYIDVSQDLLIGRAEDGMTFTVNGSEVTWSGGSMTAEIFINPVGTFAWTKDGNIAKGSHVYLVGYDRNVLTNGYHLADVGYISSGQWHTIDSAYVLCPQSDIETISYISTDIDKSTSPKSGDVERIVEVTMTGTWTDGSESEVEYTYMIVPTEVMDDSNHFMNTVFRLLPLIIILGAGIMAYMLLRYR